MSKIEKKVADTILQREEKIVIAGETYPIGKPTPATLILISELVAEMPEVRPDTDNVLFEILNTAKDTAVLGRVAATLILGAKRIKENHLIETVVPKRRFSVCEIFRGLFGREKERIPEIDYLSEIILHECTNAELTDIVTNRLSNMEIADFFGLTTSLSGANLLKRTREVVATASGD